MDVVSSIGKSPFGIAHSAPHLRFHAAVVATCVSFIPISSNLSAQTQLVEIASEPKLASSPLAKPTESLDTHYRKERQEVGEPDRMQQTQKVDASRSEDIVGKNDSTKKTASFLPPQRPIGQVSIDPRSKPKNGNNAVPENLAATTLGQTQVVHASTSDEMLGGMVFVKSLNHDELFAYHPLYFEEANLERYGRTCGRLQPALSGLRFFATIPSLPYAMTVHNPRKTYTTQWPYEAGWGAPKVREFRPLEAKPSLVQAAAITGLLFVLP